MILRAQRLPPGLGRGLGYTGTQLAGGSGRQGRPAGQDRERFQSRSELSAASPGLEPARPALANPAEQVAPLTEHKALAIAQEGDAVEVGALAFAHGILLPALA